MRRGFVTTGENRPMLFYDRRKWDSVQRWFSTTASTAARLRSGVLILYIGCRMSFVTGCIVDEYIGQNENSSHHHSGIVTAILIMTHYRRLVFNEMPCQQR